MWQHGSCSATQRCLRESWALAGHPSGTHSSVTEWGYTSGLPRGPAKLKPWHHVHPESHQVSPEH